MEVLVFASQVAGIIEETLVEYAITGKATGIQLKTLNNDELEKLITNLEEETRQSLLKVKDWN